MALTTGMDPGAGDRVSGMRDTLARLPGALVPGAALGRLALVDPLALVGRLALVGHAAICLSVAA